MLFWLYHLTVGVDFLLNYEFSEDYRELIYVGDLLFTGIAIFVLILYILEIEILSKMIWLSFAIFFVTWEIAYNFVIKPILFHRPAEIYYLFFLLVLVPQYAALFIYSKELNKTSDGAPH